MILTDRVIVEDPVASVCGVSSAEIRRRCELRRMEAPGIGVGGTPRQALLPVVGPGRAAPPMPAPKPQRSSLGRARRQVKRAWRGTIAFTREIGEILAALPKLGRMRRQIKELRAEVKALRAVLGR